MSNHLTSLAYKVDVGSLLRKSVLVLLADKASDDGSGIWASKQTMADELCCSKQAVWNALQEFMAEGLLVEMGRKKHLNGYTITYALKLNVLEALPRVKRWAGNPSTVLTGQSDIPVKDDDGGSQSGLPKPPLTAQSEAKASLIRVVDHWNVVADRCNLRRAEVLNKSRTQMGLARLKEHGEDGLIRAIDMVGRSAFCRGEVGDGRRADIMMILQPKTLARVFEGYYGQDEEKRPIDPKELRASQLRTAELYDRLGRSNEADEIRRALDCPADPAMAARVSALVRGAGSPAQNFGGGAPR